MAVKVIFTGYGFLYPSGMRRTDPSEDVWRPFIAIHKSLPLSVTKVTVVMSHGKGLVGFLKAFQEMERRKTPPRYDIKIIRDMVPFHPSPAVVRGFENQHLSEEEPPQLREPQVFPYPKILEAGIRCKPCFLELNPSG